MSKSFTVAFFLNFNIHCMFQSHLIIILQSCGHSKFYKREVMINTHSVGTLGGLNIQRKARFILLSLLLKLKSRATYHSLKNIHPVLINRKNKSLGFK